MCHYRGVRRSTDSPPYLDEWNGACSPPVIPVACEAHGATPLLDDRGEGGRKGGSQIAKTRHANSKAVGLGLEGMQTQPADPLPCVHVFVCLQEPSFGVLRPFTEPAPPAPVYTPEQLKKMATAGLPEPGEEGGGKEGDDEGGAGEKAVGGSQQLAFRRTLNKKGGVQSLAAGAGPDEGAGGDDKEPEVEGPAGDEPAVPQSAQVAGGTVHKDDRYTDVENAPGPDYPPTHQGQDLDVIQFGDYPVDTGARTSKRLRGQDTIIPTEDVEMSTYPMLGLQDAQGISDHAEDEGSKPVTANTLFAKALRDNGLGDGEHIETVAGGLGANSEPPLDRIYDMMEGEHGAVNVDTGEASKVAMWVFAAMLFCGCCVLLGYNLLPEGSFSKAWANFKGVPQDGGNDGGDGSWTRAYYEPARRGGGGAPYGAVMRDVA